MIADELYAFARFAEAEGLELQHDRDDEIIVGMERGNVLDADRSSTERLLAADFVTALGHIDQVLAAKDAFDRVWSERAPAEVQDTIRLLYDFAE